MSSKNSTRISSLLGTWTGQTHLKADIGSYELMAYFAIHFMPDPMRAFACSLPNCSEFENKACVLDKNGDPSCTELTDGILDWSDVTAFMYFGAKVDVGFPFNKHREQDTGGWVGPLNIILANEGDSASLSLKGEHEVDSYISRYVETPSTEYLQMPKNCTLLHSHDFDKIAGASAVRSTVTGQYDPDGKNDPYSKYLDTCSNGDVQPLLPIFEFDFIEDNEGEDTVEVKVDYKLLTVPRKKDFVYKLYPMVQKKFNGAGVGFHIDGPFCYGDDPHRGYTFDMGFDSRDLNGMLQFQHACIEGLPCIPPAAEYANQDSSINIKPLPNNATTVGVGKYLVLGSIFIVLSFATLFLAFSNRSLRRRLAQEGVVENQSNTNDDGDGNDGRMSIPYQAMDDREESIVSAEEVEETHSVEDAVGGELDEETQQLLPATDETVPDAS